MRRLDGRLREHGAVAWLKSAGLGHLLDTTSLREWKGANCLS